MRQFSLLDSILSEIDHGLRTVHSKATQASRTSPAQAVEVTEEMTETERQATGRLMRINHTGEIAAQGLYRGQALTAKQAQTRQQLQQSGQEELDHLTWCQERLTALDSRPSLLGDFWYWGSFSIGAVNGLVGDRWSLGFVKETEAQVMNHIDDHLDRIPTKALKDIAVLKQMRDDEEAHGEAAMQAGGSLLPLPARKLLMPLLSKVMTSTSYRI